MQLKRLELYGYKSFATRTTFEFADGITSIVGPNGSGKSNIADAVRWVLGEQSFKVLRARTTADMIYAGSRNRARLGVAEAFIVLDNSDGGAPLEFSEVVIGRRAYRSGENEYLVNGSRVRYRDVLRILGDAGLMRTSYTVIGQGLVDAALSLRPDARRVLFEEAAGIAPHLRKRSQALKRVDETERNLQRVNDILHELEPIVAGLRQQAERAEQHRALTHQLQELQSVWYGHQWRRHQERLTKAGRAAEERARRLEKRRGEAQRLQEKQDRLRASQKAQRELIDRLADAQASLRDRAEVLRREMAVVAERRRLFQQQRESLRGELQALASRAAILEGEIARATQDLAGQEAAQQSCQEELKAARSELAQQDAARRSLEDQIDSIQSHLTQISLALSDSRARLEQLAEQRLALTSEEEQTRAALVELDRRLASLKAEAGQLAAREDALAGERDVLKERGAALETEATSVRAEMATTEADLGRMRSGHDHLVTRYETLTRLREELVGYYPGVREVLGSDADLPGLLGTVASLMDVPQEIEEAIEAALGPRLQNVVVERWEDAERAIDHLRRRRAGWATFLPLDTVRSAPALNIESGSWIIGVGSRLIHFQEALRPVFELLLGRTIVVRDLVTARQLLGRRMGAVLLVTLRGETVQPSGALSGGTRRSSSNLLAQEREWRGLPERIRSTEEQLAQAEQALAAQGASLADLQRQSDECQHEISQLDAQAESARAAVASCIQRQRDLERERQWRESRLAQAQETLSTLEEREQSLGDGLAASQREQLAATGRLRELRDQRAASSDEGMRQRAAELETRAAVAQRTVRSQRTLLESHHRNLEQLSDQIRDKEAQDEGLQGDLQRLQEAAESGEAALSALEGELATARERVQPARAELARLERELRDLEGRRNRSLQQLNEAELALNRARLEQDRAQDRMAALVRRIENDLGPVELPAAESQQLRLHLDDGIVELPLADTVPATLEDDIRRLKARRRRLGSINPSAPEEYRQQLDRQSFLQGQIEDLTAGIASLRKVIDELDTIIDRDFAETVKLVNEAFGAHFRSLFGGGSARLVLTQPDDLSASGVEIIARPPGKRAQSLSLLSGGERALTAVALVFALLRANPVPFCFLDEVDAMLDESNVGRFRQLLEEHARTTQFVLITHNRRTIEASSSIYGISMDEHGVSQCISLKLDALEEKSASPRSGGPGNAQ